MLSSDFAFRQNAFQIARLSAAPRKTAANQEWRAKRIADAQETIAAFRLFAAHRPGRAADEVNAQADAYEALLAAAMRGEWQ